MYTVDVPSPRDDWPVRLYTPDLETARSMVGSLVRFAGFRITVAVKDDGEALLFAGSPLEVLRRLEQVGDDCEVEAFRSELAPEPRRPARARSRWS